MATTIAENSRVLTSEAEAGMAEDVLENLSGRNGVLAVEKNGERMSVLPREVGEILQHVLEVMARGGTVTVTALPEELTTTSAAAVLGVSRPTLMTMVQKGVLPSHKVGSHTRLRSQDVFAERAARRAREREAFAQLRDMD